MLIWSNSIFSNLSRPFWSLFSVVLIFAATSDYGDRKLLFPILCFKIKPNNKSQGSPFVKVEKILRQIGRAICVNNQVRVKVQPCPDYLKPPIEWRKWSFSRVPQSSNIWLNGNLEIQKCLKTTYMLYIGTEKWSFAWHFRLKLSWKLLSVIGVIKLWFEIINRSEHGN